MVRGGAGLSRPQNGRDGNGEKQETIGWDRNGPEMGLGGNGIELDGSKTTQNRRGMKTGLDRIRTETELRRSGKRNGNRPGRKRNRGGTETGRIGNGTDAEQKLSWAESKESSNGTDSGTTDCTQTGRKREWRGWKRDGDGNGTGPETGRSLFRSRGKRLQERISAKSCRAFGGAPSLFYSVSKCGCHLSAL